MNESLTLTEGLTIVALIVSIISMSISIMALWPQCRHGVAAIRDAVLWMALIFIVVGLVTAGWKTYGTTKHDETARRTSTQSGNVAGKFP